MASNLQASGQDLDTIFIRESDFKTRFGIAYGLWTCGYNNRGQLGDGTITPKSSPVQVGSLTNWAQVAGGFWHTAAVKTDGSLWTCGYNAYSQLGDGTTTWRSSPVQVGSLTNWAQVACGYYHTAAVSLPS
ncbi:MAG: hypothetical protein GW809_09530 [Bacteroidetes bacterium]|nr:hypothetical protein [Bacteroidota bacterium]